MQALSLDAGRLDTRSSRATLYNNTAIVPATAGRADLVVGPTPTYDAQLFQDSSSEVVPAVLPADLGC